MSERRSFLKAASLLPLSILANTPAAMAGTETSSPPLEDSEASGESRAHPMPPPPPQPPIQEQAFADYHLLGKPVHDANLFGEVRPHDWKTTKADLAAALKSSAVTGDPIHDWLKTFEKSLDEVARNIVLEAGKYLYRVNKPSELKYEPQLYDSSLRSASVLLDRCLRYRNEMGSFETAGIGTGIAYLTFIRVKPLQRNFLIQSNAADLAKIEQTTEATVSHRYKQIWGIDKLFERRQLQAKEAEADGSAEEAARAEVKDNFLSALLQKQFHFQIDAQLAQFTRLISPGSSSNFAERYLRLLAMLTEDLSDAYCKLFSASKGIQQVLNLSTVTVAMGSAVNVDIPLFTTTAHVDTWINQIVPSLGGNQRKPDILDALVLWARAIMRELDATGQYESEFTVAIPLCQPWGKNNPPILSSTDISGAFVGASATGKLTFKLPNNSLPVVAAPSNIRVIGIGLTVEYSPDDASPVQYIPGFPATPSAQPAVVERFENSKMARLNATVATPMQTLQGGGTYSRPQVFLPSVRIQGGNGGDLEPVLSYDPACRGLNPFGSWTISMDKNAIAFCATTTQQTDSQISGLILYLRLRGTLA
jgi:hypothetical protein